ncbi:hypothetical protein NDU88_010419 [Pleurodeles waltl]|uniref:Uncharacterized protein n=1 Tax=Pleurodeles waltl TaxID=8319 RepID=A0AAV7RZL2_PLEWA|nr:hypothetical protein NDU88_010419 [Pleurodeles waltl]
MSERTASRIKREKNGCADYRLEPLLQPGRTMMVPDNCLKRIYGGKELVPYNAHRDHGYNMEVGQMEAEMVG